MTNGRRFRQRHDAPFGGASAKLYRVTVQPRATEQQVLQLSSGGGAGRRAPRPCPAPSTWWWTSRAATVMEITLKEGKNREIRRMCEAVSLEVVRLKRNAEGVVRAGDAGPRQVTVS